MNQLHWADYIIYIGFLLISIAIGIYHACTGDKQRTTSEFILANRKLRVIPTMLSLLVSHQSAIMILGHTAEVYTRGTRAFGMELMAYTLVLIIVERLFVPWIFPMKLVTIYSYLENRYKSRSIRILGAVSGCIIGTLYMGTAMYAPAIALEAATGVATSISIPVMAVVCTVYTALGGMRAVIWTDVFQFVIMLGGLIAILIMGSLRLGGFSNVISKVEEGGRFNWLNIDPDPTVRHTLWGYIFGYVPLWINAYGLTQASVQRFCSVTSLRAARLTVLSNILPLLGMVTVASLIGMVVYAYFHTLGCDPLANKDIGNPNQLLSYFVVENFAQAPGFAGLFLATLYSGALSSVSSTLSGNAAITWDDILKFKLENRFSEYQQSILQKVLVSIYGGLAIVLAYIAAVMPGPVSQISLALIGTIGGPMFGLFILGGVFRRANWVGAWVGWIAGAAFNLWVGVGARTINPRVAHPSLSPAPSHNCSVAFNMTTPSITVGSQTTAFPTPEPSISGISRLYALSYVWYTTFGALICITVGLLVSFIYEKASKQELEEVDDVLLIPWRKVLDSPFKSEDTFEVPKSGDQNANANTTDEKKGEVYFSNAAYNQSKDTLNASLSDSSYSQKPNPPEVVKESNI